MNVRALPLLCFLIAVACASMPVTVCAQADKAAARQKAWRQRLDRVPFVFLEGSAGVLSSLDRFKAKVRVHVIYDSAKPKTLEFEFVNGGEVVLSLKGDRNTSFAGGDNKLFLAEYDTDYPGCTIVAYGLSSGEQVWRTKLHQKQPAGASAYRNRVTLAFIESSILSDEKKEGTVLVTGSESYCDYKEALDAETGESLAIKHYRVGFGE